MSDKFQKIDRSQKFDRLKSPTLATYPFFSFPASLIVSGKLEGDWYMRGDGDGGGVISNIRLYYQLRAINHFTPNNDFIIIKAFYCFISTLEKN